MLLVALVPVAHSWAKTETQPKRAATWGHGASHLTTCPRACNVTQITSPSPEVLTTVPPVAGPSQVVAQSLFEESVTSDIRETEPKVVVPYGELTLVLSA